MEWEKNVDSTVELAELVEEAALAELTAFGCIEFEEGVSFHEWAELDNDPIAEFAFDCAGWDYDESRGLTEWYQRSIDLIDLY